MHEIPDTQNLLKTRSLLHIPYSLDPYTYLAYTLIPLYPLLSGPLHVLIIKFL